VEDHFTLLKAVLDGSQLSKRYLVVKTVSVITGLFISVYRMPFMAPTLDNDDPLFALVISPALYLHNAVLMD